jgi:hypothetical protein
MQFYKRLIYNSRNEHSFLLKPQYIVKNIVNEDTSMVPRFTIKNPEIFSDFPTNTPMKFDLKLIEKAIDFGMILQIDYKGEDDRNFSGHERSIYPLALGKSKDGKYLIRGYHLKGWSVSQSNNIEKEWRLFRADRILNITFTGGFFRLAPDGYNETGDKSMSQLIKNADFNNIRNNQQKLLQQNTIDLQDKVIINKINKIEVKDMNFNLKLFKPYEGNVIPKKDAKNIRITFAKPVIGTGQWIAIIGTSINKNNIFKVISNNTELGSYKSVKWIMGDELETLKVLEQQVEFKTYLFLKGQ